MKQKIKKKKKINYYPNASIIILIMLLIILLILITYQYIKYEQLTSKQTTSEVVQNGDNLENGQAENNISNNQTGNIIEIEIPEKPKRENDWRLILINKDNPIPENYSVDLVEIENGHKVDSRIADELKQMLEDARKEGLNPLICSSYRTEEKQNQLFQDKIREYKRKGYENLEAEEVASYWVAPTNRGEHQSGLAVDIVSQNYQILDEKQEQTDVQKWLIQNSYKYGFILRYPTSKKDITKINYEPWHYRYVGKENAEIIMKNNICLEEYLESEEY